MHVSSEIIAPVPGLRVVRGPDWNHLDRRYGGIGHVGTVQSYREKLGYVNVLWDNGESGLYRVGADDAYDLLVLDTGPAGL